MMHFREHVQKVKEREIVKKKCLSYLKKRKKIPQACWTIVLQKARETWAGA